MFAHPPPPKFFTLMPELEYFSLPVFPGAYLCRCEVGTDRRGDLRLCLPSVPGGHAWCLGRNSPCHLRCLCPQPFLSLARKGREHLWYCGKGAFSDGALGQRGLPDHLCGLQSRVSEDLTFMPVFEILFCRERN